MKKNKIERNVVSLPLQEIGVVKYSDSLDKEFEFIKSVEMEPNDPSKELKKSTHTKVYVSKDKFILNRPELKKIYQFCQEQVDSYVDNILHSSTKIKINSSWIAMNKTGSKTEPHVHSSVVNGCFYINLPDDTTPLVLNIHNCLDLREFFPLPIENKDLVIWDNKLSHWVPENKSKHTRYSLAFNTSLAEQYEFSLALAEAFNNPNSDVKNIKNNKGEVPTQGVL